MMSDCSDRPVFPSDARDCNDLRASSVDNPIDFNNRCWSCRDFLATLCTSAAEHLPRAHLCNKSRASSESTLATFGNGSISASSNIRFRCLHPFLREELSAIATQSHRNQQSHNNRMHYVLCDLNCCKLTAGDGYGFCFTEKTLTKPDTPNTTNKPARFKFVLIS